jgi:hypothetical protein
MNQDKRGRVASNINTQALRTRAVPPAIAELLSIANRISRELLSDSVHDAIANSKRYGYDQHALGYFLSRAVEQLPDGELKAFVNLEVRLDEDSGFVVVNEELRNTGGYLATYSFEVGAAMGVLGTGAFDVPVEAKRQRYLFLIALKQILNAIAEKDLSPVNEINQHSTVIGQVDYFRGRLFVKDGKIQFLPPLLFQVLETAEPERIRKCAVCERLFWAGRLDKRTCRPLCSNVWRAKNWRKRQAAKLKAKAKPVVSKRKPVTKKKKTEQAKKGR